MRGAYFNTAGIFYVLAGAKRFVYRPYIYQISIMHYGFADVVGNLVSTIVIIFMELGITHATRKEGMGQIGLITLGNTLYDLTQFILPGV